LARLPKSDPLNQLDLASKKELRNSEESQTRRHHCEAAWSWSPPELRRDGWPLFQKQANPVFGKK